MRLTRPGTLTNWQWFLVSHFRMPCLTILRPMRCFLLLCVLVCFSSLYMIFMMGCQFARMEKNAAGLHCMTETPDTSNLRNTLNRDNTTKAIHRERMAVNRRRNDMHHESNIDKSIELGEKKGNYKENLKYQRLIYSLRKLADTLTSHDQLLIRNATFEKQVIKWIEGTIHHITTKGKQNIQPQTTISPQHSDDRISLLRHGLCPEVYNDSTHGYPFFETGFVTSYCEKESKPIGDYISAVFNFMTESSISSTEVQALIYSYTTLYPSIPVYVVIPAGITLGEAVHACAHVEMGDHEVYPGSAWNRAIALVKTEFIFVSTGVSGFDDDSNLERLLRSIIVLDVPIVGGAIKTPTGSWDMGCVQTVFRNYSLIYFSGYWHSLNECVFCTHISSPFLAKTQFLLDHKLPENIEASVLFTEYFLSLSQTSVHFAVCPDVMFHITESYLSNHNASTWLPMARRWKIIGIRFPDKHEITYACDELKIKCAFQSGIAVPPCCLRLLSEQIKYIMRTCEKHHIICELQEGTLMGAVKFGKVLSWERDADITVLSSNFSAFVNLSPVFASAGYFMRITGQTKCCVEGRLAGGTLIMSSRGSPWYVEVYGQHRMDSEM